jgi:hypothetical protein
MGKISPKVFLKEAYKRAYLVACLPNPVPLSPFAKVAPSPVKAYFEVIRAPAFRFLVVCAPVCREGTTSRRFPWATRRRLAVGRVRD